MLGRGATSSLMYYPELGINTYQLEEENKMLIYDEFNGSVYSTDEITKENLVNLNEKVGEEKGFCYIVLTLHGKDGGKDNVTLITRHNEILFIQMGGITAFITDQSYAHTFGFFGKNLAMSITERHLYNPELEKVEIHCARSSSLKNFLATSINLFTDVVHIEEVETYLTDNYKLFRKMVDDNVK